MEIKSTIWLSQKLSQQKQFDKLNWDQDWRPQELDHSSAETQGTKKQTANPYGKDIYILSTLFNWSAYSSLQILQLQYSATLWVKYSYWNVTLHKNRVHLLKCYLVLLLRNVIVVWSQHLLLIDACLIQAIRNQVSSSLLKYPNSNKAGTSFASCNIFTWEADITIQM